MAYLSVHWLEEAAQHLSTLQQLATGILCGAGHGATIHACTVEDGSLVGMGATVLDGATVSVRSGVGTRQHHGACYPSALASIAPWRLDGANIRMTDQENDWFVWHCLLDTA